MKPILIVAAPVRPIRRWVRKLLRRDWTPFNEHGRLDWPVVDWAPLTNDNLRDDLVVTKRLHGWYQAGAMTDGDQ